MIRNVICALTDCLIWLTTTGATVVCGGGYALPSRSFAQIVATATGKTDIAKAKEPDVQTATGFDATRNIVAAPYPVASVHRYLLVVNYVLTYRFSIFISPTELRQPQWINPVDRIISHIGIAVEGLRVADV